MTTHFVTIEVEIQAADKLNQAIEAALRHHGTPLRWAITQIDSAQHKAIIEAIVTCE